MSGTHPLAGTVAIAVMGKAPRPGRAKTRLCPPLEPAECAQMAAAFLRDVTANVALASTGRAPVHGYVAYAPAGEEALLEEIVAPGTRLVLADGTGGEAPGVEGFGRCLLHATRALFERGYGAVCVLNADSPTLPTALLRRAARALVTAPPGGPERAVLGPAEDGGYYLLGMTSPRAHLYAGVDWSTERVAAQTRERAAEAGVELLGLPAWYDVDDRAALVRLAGEVASARSGGEVMGGADAVLAPNPAPATAAAMARLRIAPRLGLGPIESAKAVGQLPAASAGGGRRAAAPPPAAG